MFKKTLLVMLSSCFFSLSIVSHAAPEDIPDVTGEPVIVQHLGKLEWPQDDEVVSTPSLTQLVANDINDLHGNLSCELIISTPGNYHMALKDAMFGEPDLLPVGLLKQEGTPSQFKVSICWSTSPPVSIDQITAEELQFKNIKMVGRPSLAMAPGGVMNDLVANGMVDAATRQTFLVNQGNVILIRTDKATEIYDVCDLGKDGIRVVTPNPDSEPGSFKNFSGTIFNVALNNPNLRCSNTADPNNSPANLYNSIFTQDLSLIDTSSFNNPYDINGVLSVFGRGAIHGNGAKWVASSRIMHRDIPYALCHDEADAAVIFYHQAVYLKEALASSGCNLEIVSLDGSGTIPTPDLLGNKVGALDIAKVKGSYAKKVNDARDKIYDFLTSDPSWTDILVWHGMRRP